MCYKTHCRENVRNLCKGMCISHDIKNHCAKYFTKNYTHFYTPTKQHTKTCLAQLLTTNTRQLVLNTTEGFTDHSPQNIDTHLIPLKINGRPVNSPSNMYKNIPTTQSTINKNNKTVTNVQSLTISNS